MENKAHGESREKRLECFKKNPPEEVIDTLLNSLNNYFNNEITLTTKAENAQTSLMFLGIHSVALTVSEGLFGKTGLTGYKLYLKNFVDGDTDDTKFSKIADLIHDWRNILAHQWLGSAGHKFGYDYQMSQGWQLRDDICYINPRTYCFYFLKSFEHGGRIWKFDKLLNRKELEQAKHRIIKKYLKK
jgi:hypothetical protein